MRTRAVGAVAGVLLLAGCTAASTPHRPAAPPVSPLPARPPAGSSHSTHPRLHLAWLPDRLPQPLAREAVSPAPDRWHATVAGGLLAGDTSSRSTYRLDLHTGRSIPLGDLAIPVHDATGARVAGQAVVIGGGNAAEQSAVQERGASGWRAVGSLPTPRSDLTAVSARGRTYVVGGHDGTSPAVPGVLSSRDGRHWTRITTLVVPVRYAAAVRVGGTLWVFGGEVAGAMVDGVQRVDLRTGRARIAGHLPMALGHSAAVRLGEKVLLIGGRTASHQPTARMWWVHLRPWHIRSAGTLPVPLADTGLVVGARGAYLVGGERPTFSDRVLRVSWS